MSNIYVSPTGNDTTGDGSELNPFLTFQKAFNDPGTISGDSIIAQDGEYIEPSGYIYIANKTDLEILPVNDYGVTIKCLPGQDRIIHIEDTATRFKLGKVILDGENLNTGLMTTDNAIATEVLIDGAILRNCTDTAYSSSKTGKLTLNNVTFENMPRAVNLYSTLANAEYIIKDVTFINTIPLTLSKGTPFKITPSAIECTLDLQNVTVDVSIDSSDTTSRHTLEVSGIHGGTIDNFSSKYDANGAIAKVGGVYIAPNAILTKNLTVKNCIVGDNNRSRQNYGIIAGTETTGTDNTIENLVVRNNKAFNCGHSFMFGFITGARGFANYAENCDLGFLAKGTNSCFWFGGVVVDAGIYATIAKADTSSIFANNTLISKTDSPQSSFMFSTFDLLNGVDDSTGTQFINNNVYDFMGTHRLTYCLANSDADYKNNNFYQPNGAAGNRYNYKGIDYATLALWETGAGVAGSICENNTEIDPAFKDYTNGDYSLLKRSELIADGVKWWTGVNPQGYDGEPFSTIDTDIGAIQSKYGRFHPENL